MARKASPCIDIGHSSLKILRGGSGLELPLERTTSGKLTPQCQERVTRQIREFLGVGQGAGRRAFCGLPARGASLRRLDLPPASREETRRLLALQVEKEFPLPLTELSWAYQMRGSLNGDAPVRRSGPQDTTVVAVRRQALNDYSEFLSGCGLKPTFLLGAFAAATLCADTRGRYAILDVGKTHSELTTMENGVPIAMSTLNWGGDDVTRSVAGAMEVGIEQAEELKRREADPSMPLDLTLSSSLGSAAEELARQLEATWARDEVEANGRLLQVPERRVPSRLYLFGGASRQPGLVDELEQALGGKVACQILEVDDAPGHSAVTVGLARMEGKPAVNGTLQFSLREKPEIPSDGRAPTAVGRWIAVALALAVTAFGLRYVLPFHRLSGLEERLATMRAYRDSLPSIDSELRFMEELEAAQLPYLEALAALGTSAPKGTQISSVSMDRSGKVALNGIVKQAKQANEFRGKLILSGRFSQAVLQELAPTRDGKKWEFRMMGSMAARPLSPAAPDAATPSAGTAAPVEPASVEEPAASSPAEPAPSEPPESGESASDAAAPGPEAEAEAEASAGSANGASPVWPPPKPEAPGGS